MNLATSRLRSRLSAAALAGALALAAGPGLAGADTWTKMSATIVRHDFPFPDNFYADYAVAIHDTNGNCQIDSYGIGDPATQFPYLLAPSGAVTLGRHIGSPFGVVPGVDPNTGMITATAIPGLCGRTMIYGEMIQGNTTYFMWFALPEGPAPAGYDAAWGMDFGVGSYEGNDARTSPVVYHATHVKDFRASNGDPGNVVGPAPAHWWRGTPGTLANPGHVFSVDPDPTRSWPRTWSGLSVAGTLAGDPYLNYFVGFQDVLIDVPIVAEGDWDGATLFPSVSSQFGRSISPINGGADNRVTSRSLSMPSTRELAGDFNGDGRADIALWNPGWGSVPIYTSTGTGFTITNVGMPAGMNWINDPAASRLVGDFTGDGRTDIAMWKRGWGSIPVYASNGNGGFTITNGPEPSGANLINQQNAPAKLVGDFDGDGRDDIALMRSDWSSVPIYFSNGNRTFRWTNFLAPANQNWINWAGVRRLVGDFNADGRADILVTSAGWGATALYVSNGNGAFTCLVGASGAGNWMNNMAANPLVGDFNGDGRTDVAFWRPGWSSTPVYFSNGNGTWQITNFITSSAEVNDAQASKHVGDFDGDGRSDIAVTKGGYAGVVVFTSSGNGSFTRAVRTPSGNTNGWINRNGTGVLAGDFTGDGRTDLSSRAIGYISTPIYASLGNGFTGTLAFHPAGMNWINQ